MPKPACVCLSFALSAACAAVLAAPPTPASAPATQPAGLAAKHPGDVGLDRDPAVLLQEDFEDEAKVFDGKRWTGITGRKTNALRLTREPADVFGGKQALQVTATLGKDTGGHLFRRFQQGVERMHLRFCVKFAPDCDYIHHFVTLAAELPAVPWPTGGAGLRPAGDKKFTIGIEPWGQWRKFPPPGAWHFYNYWWQMKAAPDGKFWGGSPDGANYGIPQRGRWYCVEVMVGCNTPSQGDGELALWIDGKQLCHHKTINWRTSDQLKLNGVWLMLYVTDAWTKHEVNTVFFDDVVVATQYIGPPIRANR